MFYILFNPSESFQVLLRLSMSEENLKMLLYSMYEVGQELVYSQSGSKYLYRSLQPLGLLVLFKILVFTCHVQFCTHYTIIQLCFLYCMLRYICIALKENLLIFKCSLLSSGSLFRKILVGIALKPLLS
jgi:hypothetical protein